MKTFPVLAAFALAGCAAGPAPMDAPASLAAAETAFAAHSMRENMRPAFLANFADDGVTVRQKGWTISNAFLATRPNPPIVLDWRPAYVEVAAAGDLGLSTGPTKLTSLAKPDAPPRYGQYVSVWRRQDGGPWKVAVDLGISHATPVLWSQPLEAGSVSSGRGRGNEAGLRAAEEKFGRESASSGARAAYAVQGSPRMRFYREGTAPVIGKTEALAAPTMSDERLVWTVERAEIATSGDLGYARGSYASASAPGKALGHYLRVWRYEDGDWRVAMDVANPAAEN